MSTRAYHHGDLRRTLVEATLELIEEGSEVSLREVARRAGVSTAAPYHHFATRDDLLVEVALEGFRSLGKTLARVDRSPLARNRRIEARVRAYLRFALSRGAHYRVMFSAHASAADLAKRHEEAARESFSGLVAAIFYARPDLEEDEARALALTTWSAAHGAVMLILDGGAAALGRSKRHVIADTARHLAALVQHAPRRVG